MTLMFTGARECLMVSVSEVFFKIKLNIFLDTLILKRKIIIIKINTFRGDLSGITAKKLHWLACVNSYQSYALYVIKVSENDVIRYPDAEHGRCVASFVIVEFVFNYLYYSIIWDTFI